MAFSKIWRQYRHTVSKYCCDNKHSFQDLPYWRNHLFATTITYIIPLSLLAIIPGVYMSLETGLILLAFVDASIFFVLIFIGLYPGLTVKTRKFLFIFTLYFLTVILLYYLGPHGPGLLYLFVITVFTILISGKKFGFLSAFINTIICIVFGYAIYSGVVDSLFVTEYSLGAWVAVSSNVVFLSFLSAALIPRLFEGMQSTIDVQNRLRNELNEKQETLEHSLGELKIKNEELEQFAYVASHDLQEPLRMITGFLDRLKAKYDVQLDDKGRQYIEFAHGGATKLKIIIQELLTFSRADNPDEHVIEEVDTQMLVNNVCHLMKYRITETDADIKVGNLPIVETYQTPLRQIFQNLIDNALKYQNPGLKPRIEIASDENDTHWFFYVKDNGIGIKPEYFDKIFIIFQRLHGQQDYQGTGMGLALTKKIVGFLGGEITVESEEGQGSTFSFSILKNLKF